MSEYTVKRAIIMAAGEGKRLRPLTLKTPKPLIEVNGIRMIDTLIDALLSNGITDIHIVTGYMADSFDVLISKYPMIAFVHNPDYGKYNNISSLYYARDLLDTEVIIADADQIIRNNGIMSSRFAISGYNAARVDSYTNEWVMMVNNGIVQSCSKNGADHGWQLFSVSRWTKEDALRLKKLVVLEFEINNRGDIYWDDIPMFLHSDDFELGITVIERADLIEIDSLEELQMIDANYM